MKKLPFIILILLTLNSSSQKTGQEKYIEFNHNSWDAIVALAKAENKLIFLDAYTSWCSPCKWVAEKIFTNNEVAGYYNETFINATIDMEKGEGINLSKKFHVEAYPTFLFINSNEEIVYSVSGVNHKKKFHFSFIQYGKNAVEQQKKIAAEK